MNRAARYLRRRPDVLWVDVRYAEAFGRGAWAVHLHRLHGNTAGEYVFAGARSAWAALRGAARIVRREVKAEREEAKKSARARRDVGKRRAALIEEAEHIDRRLSFSSDFFLGDIAGPRRRDALYARRKHVKTELEQIEREQGEGA